jgi:hypothetical protein
MFQTRQTIDEPISWKNQMRRSRSQLTQKKQEQEKKKEKQ